MTGALYRACVRAASQPRLRRLTIQHTLKYGSAMPLPAKTTVLAFARSPARWAQAGLLAAAAWACVQVPRYISRPATRASAASSKARALATSSPTRLPGAAPSASALTGQAAAGQTLEVRVRRNDTLEAIFHREKLSLADLAAIRSLPGLRNDLDRLHPGESLTLVREGDELLGLTRRLSLAQSLEVRRSATGFEAHLVAIPLETRTRTLSGEIDSSLFEAMAAAGGHDSTTLALADIFAWDIDFVNEIQPGDRFTVTYDEVYDHGKYAEDGPILAARFINNGHEYVAVRYVSPSGQAAYYTPDGRSMRKAFLRAPLEFTRVSSPFSLHRRHPILNLIRRHTGVDYAAPIGTPVWAAGDGRVIFAGRKGGYGNAVVLDHAHGITTLYGHLSRFARGLHVGEHVSQGTVIAYVGMTGLATGPHLHYEFRVDGVYKNPQTVILPDAVPIEAGLRADFLAKTGPLLGSLYPLEGPALVSR
ncbi:MAG: peptidoglycan DD-metalloendopeptidase family protein [Steroidobacteraceae bacterium]